MGDTYVEHGSAVKIAPNAIPAIIAAVDAAAANDRSIWAGQRTVVAAGTSYTGQAKPAGSGTITFVISSTSLLKEAPAKASPVKAAPKKSAKK
jgi:hypothetical protein